MVFHGPHSGGKMAACSGSEGDTWVAPDQQLGGPVYRALIRIIHPYFRDKKPRPFPAKPIRRRLLDSEKKLLDTLRGG